jgi:glyoxylase-like metal-dependent hydrolase (beta-lactamase superfamily II)
LPGPRVGNDVEFFESPDSSHNTFGGIQDVIRSSAREFLDAYRSELRPFDRQHQVAPGIVVTLTGGHTPGHSVVRIASGGDRLTFTGEAVVPAGIEYPDWENAFDHEPEDATRVRVRLLREAARTGELFLASHLSFPSLGRVAAAGKAFRYLPANWAYWRLAGGRAEIPAIALMTGRSIKKRRRGEYSARSLMLVLKRRLNGKAPQPRGFFLETGRVVR